MGSLGAADSPDLGSFERWYTVHFFLARDAPYRPPGAADASRWAASQYQCLSNWVRISILWLMTSPQTIL